MFSFFVLLSALLFIVSFIAYMYSLIKSYSIKQILIKGGKEHFNSKPSYKEMQQTDPQQAKQYRLALLIWKISLCSFLLTLVLAFFTQTK